MKTTKWAIIVLLFFSLVSLVPGHSHANSTFTDVTSKDDFYKELNYLSNKKVISGYANGSFKPGNNLTRAQASKMLVIATGKENMPQPALTFRDIDPKKTAEQYKYISRAVSLGYFKADHNNLFFPNEEINRDEMAYALSVAFGLTEKITGAKPLKLSDVANHKYAERINGLYYAGVTQGDAGKFLPNHKLTRKHFVLFVARAMDASFSLPVKQPDQTAGTSFVRVNTGADSLNIRSTASDSAKILGTLQHGTVVEVLATNGDWLHIKTNIGNGYIHGYFTVPAGTDTPSDNPVKPPVVKPPVVKPPVVKPQEPSISSGLVGKVTVDNLNVRASATSNAPILDKLKRGQEVQVVQLDGYWATIKYNSKTGYVHKSYLKLINKSDSPLKDRVIVIDAGHGGKDPGTSSNGLTEKSITLNVSKRVESKLKNAGAKVLMTRTGDTYPSLTDRTEFAKKNYAETFVSIHVNSATASAKGTETFFDSSSNPNSVESKSLATYINNNIVKQADMVNRGVKDAKFQVIRNNNVAAVLVELGFITNSDDFAKLSSDQYLEIYAEAIYQGIVQYYAAG